MTTADATDELEIVRTGCGLVDRSARGKLALTGTDAKSFLAGQVTNDVEGLEPGQGLYAAFLTHKGKMQGDLRVLDVGPPTPELWLDCERGALQALFDTIRRFKIGYDVELHKRTVEQAVLSLVGPQARAAAGAPGLGLPTVEHANVPGRIGDADVLFVATDLGVDVVCAVGDSATVLQTLAVPLVSEAAAEVLRVESGRPRFGLDIDETTIPQEAGLNARAVSFTKGCYVGQETVARLFYKGKPNRHLRGLRLAGPAETGAPLTLGEREVGRLGTVVESPEHGWIALALLRREAEPGVTVAVDDGGTSAVVVDVPFAASPTAA